MDNVRVEGLEQRTTLREMITALGGHLVDVVIAPKGLAVGVRDVVVADPYDDPALRPGDVVLVVGARGADARPLVAQAGSRGAAAVVVKSGVILKEAARDAGVALLTVDADARWDQVQTLLRSGLATAEPVALPNETGDLFALAQTIATLTGGSVSIEDVGSRVLAYSAVAGEVDDLRLRSILGRRGPESYLALLREWGVYDELRQPDHVVTVPDHPELGIRRRLAIGLHAGGRQLGSLWVQEGGRALAEGAAEVLVGAARLAAQDVVAQAHGATSRGSRSRLLADGLTGRVPGGLVAADLGLPAGPALLVACDIRDQPGDGEPAGAALRRARAAEIIAVHAAAFRRSAVTAQVGPRVYALLPGLDVDPAGPQAQTWAAETTEAVRRESGFPVRAAIVTAATEALEQARSEADQVLRVLLRSPARPVGTMAQVRAAVLLEEALDATAGLRHPGLDALAAHDAAHHGELGATLSSYLDAFGDVAIVAAQLHVHPNTVRHRVRRAAEIAGLELGDPEQRLLAALLLRGARRGQAESGRP
ncbi:MAG: helix-turn-helix domain-containing protein [Hamadaea sp.]|nr:helix-turn-helix domain-containing protein [Hamadaea sp.]